MILTADEVIRSLRGSLRLFRCEPEGLRAFDTSVEGCWRSFAAILLATPALVITLADARLDAGLFLPGTGLLDDGYLVARETLLYLGEWIAFPLLMIGFVRVMNLEARYAGYLVAYNWSVAFAAGMFAFPKLMHVLGLATEDLATFYTVPFAIFLIHYRWFLARAALGASSGLAALVVALDLATMALVRTVVLAITG